MAAVRAGDLILLALHRGGGDDFETPLRGTMESLGESLRQLDRPLPSIVKVGVYLKDIGDLGSMEKLFGDYFEPGSYPARMTTTVFFHADCLVMIDGIATARDDM